MRKFIKIILCMLLVFVQGFQSGIYLDAQSSLTSTMFSEQYDDNTWLFVGGEVVEGDFYQTLGARNYIGHFEEYIRWNIKMYNENIAQRYTINQGIRGQSLNDIVEEFDDKIKKFNPKTIVYMLSSEDYLNATTKEEFQNNLKTLIEKSIDVRSNHGGFIVLQLGYATSNTTYNEKIQIYNDWIKQTVEEYQGSVYGSHICIIDHYTQTKDNDTFLNKLNSDMTLNAWGHFIIAEQLLEGVYQAVDGFPAKNITLDYAKHERASAYVDEIALVKAMNNTLTVNIDKTYGDEWYYELKCDAFTMKGEASSSTFTITDVPMQNYQLKLRSADGIQLTTLTGTMENGEIAQPVSVTRNTMQEDLYQKIISDKALTWVFAGDSITHASIWTYGYDSTPQLMEKYMRDVWKRNDDTFINTGVCSATTQSTLNRVNRRITDYQPDVLVIMLGTNDNAGRVSKSHYLQRMQALIDAAKAVNQDVTIVLRTPAAHFHSGYGMATLSDYVNYTEELAQTNRCIMVDQYNGLHELFTTDYPWLKNDLSFFGDAIHPGAGGQIIMTRRLLKEMGLWSEDSWLADHWVYQELQKQQSTIEAPIVKGNQQIAVSITELEKLCNEDLCDVVLKAIGSDGRIYQGHAKNESIVLAQLPKDSYDVSVTAYSSSQAKEISFPVQLVNLNNQEDTLNDIVLDVEYFYHHQVGDELARVKVTGSLLDYTYSIVKNNQNEDYFILSKDIIIAKKNLIVGETYQITIQAQNQYETLERTFTIAAKEPDVIYQNQQLDLSEGYSLEELNHLKNITDGSILIQYQTSIYKEKQIIYSQSNGTSQNEFSIIVEDDILTVCLKKGNTKIVLTADNVISGSKNTIALRMDKNNKTYSLFVNGVCEDTKTVSYFLTIEDLQTTKACLGKNSHSSGQAYFEGCMNDIQIFGTCLSEVYLESYTKQTALKPLNNHNLINTNANSNVSVVAYSSQCVKGGNPNEDGEANNVLDYNEMTNWHSDYINSVYLPQYITFDLGDNYHLSDICFLPRQDGNTGNGDIFYMNVYVGNTLNEMKKVGSYRFEEKNGLIVSRNEWKRMVLSHEARYVKLEATEAGGQAGQDLFASMSEIRFYGLKHETMLDTTAIEALLNEAKTMSKEGYCSHCVENLLQQISNIEKQLTSVSSQEEIDQLYRKLELTIVSLEQLDITPLMRLILFVTKMDQEKYVDKTWTNLQNILNDVIKNINSIQSNEVVAREQAKLQAAVDALIKIPERIQNVKGIILDYKTIQLTWDAQKDISYYQIYRLDTNKNKWIKNITTETNSIKISGLKTGVKYSYRIMGVKIGEDHTLIKGKASSTISLKPLLQGEAKLTLQQNEKTKFVLTWSKVDGATRYLIYRKSTQEGWKKILTLDGNTTVYTTASMIPDTYYYMVKAARYDSIERTQTNGSNVVSGTSVFEKPQIKVKKASSSSAKISWNEVEGVKYYEIYRSTSKEGSYKKLVTVNTLSYLNKSLKDNKYYYYKVRGYCTYHNNKIYTDFSNVISYLHIS